MYNREKLKISNIKNFDTHVIKERLINARKELLHQFFSNILNYDFNNENERLISNNSYSEASSLYKKGIEKNDYGYIVSVRKTKEIIGAVFLRNGYNHDTSEIISLLAVDTNIYDLLLKEIIKDNKIKHIGFSLYGTVLNYPVLKKIFINNDFRIKRQNFATFRQGQDTIDFEYDTKYKIQEYFENILYYTREYRILNTEKLHSKYNGLNFTFDLSKTDIYEYSSFSARILDSSTDAYINRFYSFNIGENGENNLCQIGVFAINANHIEYDEYDEYYNYNGNDGYERIIKGNMKSIPNYYVKFFDKGICILYDSDDNIQYELKWY